MLGNETAAMKKTYYYHLTGYYVLCNTTWTAEGFVAERRTI